VQLLTRKAFICFAWKRLRPHLSAVSTTGRWAPILVVVLAVLAGVHAIDPFPVGVFYDDAHYVILGRALALGEGYRYLNIPGAPAATHYPPGYPALLALLWRIAPDFPDNVALFKMTNALLLGAVALGVYVMARRLFHMSPLAAALAALASTVTVPTLLLSSNVISEIPFLALLLPVLVASERVTSGARRDVKQAALLGLAVGALCMVRSHAVALIPAIVAAYALRKRFAEAAVAGVVAVLSLAPWLLWVQRHDALVPAALRGQYGSYSGWFLDGIRADGARVLLRAARDNLVTTWAILARSFSLANNALLDAIAVAAFLTLLVSGSIDFARRARVALLFLAGYLAIVLIWPYSPLRFVWGVWPLLVLLAFRGATVLWGAGATPRARRFARGASIAAAGVVVAGALLFNVRGYANAWWATVARSFTPRIQPQLAWVAANTKRGDIVAASDEGAIYLYTGRMALPVSSFTVDQYFGPRPAPDEAQRLSRIVNAFSPDYVLAWTTPTRNAALLLSRSQPASLVRHDTLPGGLVYRRR
jgi:hypothetical protein